MKTTAKCLGFFLVLAMFGCGQQGTTSDDAEARNPKKVLSVADLVVQHLINTAPDTLNQEWIAHLKKTRAMDQKIREEVNFKDENSLEEKSSLAGMAGPGGSVSVAQGSYVYMQSCCLCGRKCCGCTQYLISSKDVTSLSVSSELGTMTTKKEAQRTEDGPAYLFNFDSSVEDGDYMLEVNYSVGATNKTVSVPVTLDKQKVSIRK